MYKERF